MKKYLKINLSKKIICIISSVTIINESFWLLKFLINSKTDINLYWIWSLHKSYVKY